MMLIPRKNAEVHMYDEADSGEINSNQSKKSHSRKHTDIEDSHTDLGSKENQQLRDKENKQSKDEENQQADDKPKKPKYKGQLIFRTTSETHQRIVAESELRGISVNRFLEEAVQRELSAASRSPVSLSQESHFVIVQLINDEGASTMLYETIMPFLNKKFDIFRLSDALKRCLVNLEKAMEEIQPYLKPGSIGYCLYKVVILVELYRKSIQMPSKEQKDLTSHAKE